MNHSATTSEGTAPEGSPATTSDRSIAVIGLGYVGLPLAIAFTEAGLSVTGVDASPERIATLRTGRSPVDDIEDARLADALAAGMSVVAWDEAALGLADAVVVCVPTPITSTKDPDLGPVLDAAGHIAPSLRRGQLVILQSTTPGA
jgi:UDP-N-acetyl-D-glucosamine dehydrogenase